jgi:hypothetical protein
MGGMSSGQQQNQPVFYDQSTGQYYTQETPSQTLGGIFSGQPTDGNAFMNLMMGKGGTRRYIGAGANDYSPLASLIQNTDRSVNVPSIEQMFGNNAALSGLLSGSPSGATSGSKSSGAGRFM